MAGNNDWLINLTAGIDNETSRKQIDKNITDLQKQVKKLKISAEFDEDTKKNLLSQLNSLKVSLKDVTIPQETINKLVSQINDGLSKINISGLNLSNLNLNGSNVTQQAAKTGQQIGNIVSNEVDNALGKITSNGIEVPFKVKKTDSDEFNYAVNEEIRKLQQAKNELVSVRYTTNTQQKPVKDAFGNITYENIEKLTGAVFKYNTETGEAITKTMKWAQIGNTVDKNGNDIPLMGWVQGLTTYNKSLEEATVKIDTFADKQKQAVAAAENTLSTIESKLNDKGANKTLANTDFEANGLNEHIREVKTAIAELENANKDTFTQAKIKVDAAITSLNNWITTLKNAKYSATSLRAKDISKVKIDEENNLNAFVQKMEQSGHYTKELEEDVKSLRKTLESVFDTGTLTSYLNDFSNLQSKFKSVDATAKTTEKTTKIQTNVETERKILTIYKNELKEAGILTGDVKQKIQDMFHSLSKVDSQNGLTTWRAELKGTRAEIDAAVKSATQLSNKKIEEIKLSIGDNGKTTTAISAIETGYRKLGLTAEEASLKMSDVYTALDDLNKVIPKGNNNVIVERFDKLNTVLEQSQRKLKLAKDEMASINADNKNEKLQIDISGFASKITNLQRISPEISNFKTLINGAEISVESLFEDLKKVNSQSDLSVVKSKFTAFTNAAKSAGIATTEFSSIIKNQLKQVKDAFTQTFSIAAIGMAAISETKEAITELKEVDTYLTEISKANETLTKTELKAIGNSSFDTASKYGKKATNYLAGIQEASRAGYENAEGIAELSVAAQGAGDMTAELANQYIIATDKAYKLGGSVEKLTEILDGSNYITNHNAVNMTELAEGMSIVGSQAASFGIEANQTTAALGTMIATTKQSGSEMARAFRGILLNIRQVTDEEEGIDAEGLTKYEKACEDLNVSLKETKNGITSLRNPMAVIKELSEEYSKLDTNDIRRTNLLNSVGGKLRANALDALLSNYDMYSKMLNEYAQGTGSMAVEAEKTSNSLEGSLNRLSNTWTDTVENVADSDAIITAINGLNGILSAVNSITEALGSWGTIGAGIGIASSVKNVGRDKTHSLKYCFECADSNMFLLGY